MISLLAWADVTYDEFNEFCGALRGTSYVVQWGGAHVWKVGVKVFAIGGLAADAPAFIFKVDAMDFDLLCDQPGLRPAPYFASRGMKWVQHFGPDGPPDAELRMLLQASHRIVASGLTRKARRELGFESA